MHFLRKSTGKRNRENVCLRQRQDRLFLLPQMREESAQIKPQAADHQMDAGLPAGA